MKIKEEDYMNLQKALSVISKTTKNTYKTKGLGAERYYWDCFWHICNSGLFKPEELYGYLNDNHIATALKNILGPY